MCLLLHTVWLLHQGPPQPGAARPLSSPPAEWRTKETPPASARTGRGRRWTEPPWAVPRQGVPLHPRSVLLCNFLCLFVSVVVVLFFLLLFIFRLFWSWVHMSCIISLFVTFPFFWYGDCFPICKLLTNVLFTVYIFSLDCSCSGQFSPFEVRSIFLYSLHSFHLFFLHRSHFTLSKFPPLLPPPFGLHIQITSLDTEPSIPPNLFKMSILFLLGCRSYICNTHPCTRPMYRDIPGRQAVSLWNFTLGVSHSEKTYTNIQCSQTHCLTNTHAHTYSTATQSLPGVSFHFLSHDQSNLAFI